jgi:hypothetical protein
MGRAVTYLARPAVVTSCDQRGTAEQWIKEGNGAIKMEAAIMPVPSANALRLLHAVAYNLQPDKPEVFATCGPLANWIIRRLGYCSAAQQETRAGGCASSKAHP